MTAPSITLHGTPYSGHVHRVALLLRMLGLEYRFVEAPGPVRQSAAFRALNPLGQIPVLEIDGAVLADSNAILVYLAKHFDAGGTWLPETPEGAAAVQRFLSLAAGELAFGPAIARAVAQWQMAGVPAEARRVADKLLAFLEPHLAGREFLAAPHPTIADLACYSYLAHAPEGGISLDPYPALRAWLARMEALPGFFPMPRLPLPAA
ncbi:glutathione S-transferase [Siccirubricoccus sp. KC 17139]|uniref:Glutathione S-transferase n=1 Tax=Siccirubricoccus soli TaxID=2899147 RepID=A0ABT1D4V4_9PROT|nr:glutathione S-transferase [Siccirubricoccus soli]MCO6416961.1 glutathione S-transferase [Siccirubricoccus soli]MCP2683096.1 glutathione S-transferase [Siccirubricoccus soli]